MIMRVMRSWRDSLALLAPSSLKPLALVTLKSIIDTYKVLFRVWYVWLAVVIGLAARIYVIKGLIFLLPQNFTSFLYVKQVSSYYLLCVGLLNLIIIVLAARASVQKKTTTYFLNYIRYFIFLFIVFIGLDLIAFGLIYLAVLYNPVYLAPKVAQYTKLLKFTATGALTIFYVLFFLDSDGWCVSIVRSFWRALKMVIYNLPLIIVVLLAFEVVSLILIYMVHTYLPATQMFAIGLYTILAILTVIPVCIWNTIYIKRLHDQPDVYFNQPK